MGMHVPPELRAIGEIREEPLSCPVCGSSEIAFSGMALTSGQTQIGFDSNDPGALRYGEITKPPGILTASVELICVNEHCSSFVISQDWERGKGVTIGKMWGKDGVTQEEQEIASIKLAEREAREQAGRHN